MSMDLERRCLSQLLAKPLVVELSTWVGVAGWRWPISLSVIRMGTPSLQVLKRDPHSASAAEDMTLLMIVEVTRRAPLFSLMGSAFMSPR